MGSPFKKLNWRIPKSKLVIALLSLAILIPVMSRLQIQTSQNKPARYTSLQEAEEACISWQQSGDVHKSLSRDNALKTYGYVVGQGSCDFVIPSIGRRFTEQMKGKELVLSRLCMNDKANNTILGKQNNEMENGEWTKNKNEGTYKIVSTFHY